MALALRNDETSLLARLRVGDEEAYREFFDAHCDLAHRVAAGVLSDQNEAMDVVQESFIKCFRSVARFEGKSKLSTWFRRIVTNTALDHLRSRRRRREVDGHEALEAVVDDRSADKTPRPEAQAEANELDAMLKQAIQRLPEAQRQVLTLFVHGGLTYAEIAEELDIPVGTVMSRLHHARRQLREALAGTGYLEEER